MHAVIRRAICFGILAITGAACSTVTQPSGDSTAASQRTPSPAPDAFASLTPPRLTATARARGAVCQFPVDYTGDGKPEDAGIYRFTWQGKPVEVDTGVGRLTLTGPDSLQPGARDLILALDASAPREIKLPADFPLNGVVVLAPAIPGTEYRDASGQILRQHLDDPREDGLFAINQDITGLERVFDLESTFTLTVTLRGKRGIRLEARYEAWQVHLGGKEYEYRVLRNGTTESLWGVNERALEPYAGPVTFDGARLAYQFEEVSDEEFGAASYTTAVSGDHTPAFPAQNLERLYRAAYAACGP